MPARIAGITYHLPEKIETNDDLARENPDWQVDYLQAKSGIRARHVSVPGETASDLGFLAARKLLDRQLVDPREIDFLLYCTQTPDYYLPATSCLLQHRLGLGKLIGALDFNQGCSGYVYGLCLAQSLINNGTARNVLLINADTYTKLIHPRDRMVRVLFGDGAAATLISGSAEGSGRIGTFVLGTNGEGANELIVPSGGMRLPRSAETARESTDDAGCTRSQDHLYMNGKAIFSFALSVVPRLVAELLKRISLTPDQVDWYVYHQANKFMLENLAPRSMIPPERMVWCLEEVGNTVSASIPIALSAHAEAGKILPGQRLVLVGFGVGYSWGACDVIWG